MTKSISLQSLSFDRLLIILNVITDKFIVIFFYRKLTVHKVAALLEEGDIDNILNNANKIFMEPPENENEITDLI